MMTALRESPELGAEEVRSLVAIGFHGALNGKPQAALRLFEALAELRPEQPFPLIGQALALIGEGKPETAVQLLERSPPELAKHHDTISVFLGLALRLARREHQARSVLTAVAEGEGDEQARRLARQLLDQAS
ncbi:tetratricopeptide repeat protein [Pseudothauera rhizosphaerae]|uniref:Tetratricopeptide repeat-containing protein n=1 Tax=Pseudothauera rhizosphaerae TaxID=2565932 RepID=A0A4S4ADW5_9RHOO|nr:hypothetical protein [Pseudothauera rhizosphaerae]THF57273.1 hypothetical protein E6O51_18425 [Pseudothauera rhizosphaerae]